MMSRMITEVNHLELNQFSDDKTFWGMASAAVEQSRRKANRVAHGDGKFDPCCRPQDPSKPKKRPLFPSKKITLHFAKLEPRNKPVHLFNCILIAGCSIAPLSYIASRILAFS